VAVFYFFTSTPRLNFFSNVAEVCFFDPAPQLIFIYLKCFIRSPEEFPYILSESKALKNTHALLL